MNNFESRTTQGFSFINIVVANCTQTNSTTGSMFLNTEATNNTNVSVVFNSCQFSNISSCKHIFSNLS